MSCNIGFHILIDNQILESFEITKFTNFTETFSRQAKYQVLKTMCSIRQRIKRIIKLTKESSTYTNTTSFIFSRPMKI